LIQTYFFIIKTCLKLPSHLHNNIRWRCYCFIF